MLVGPMLSTQPDQNSSPRCCILCILNVWVTLVSCAYVSMPHDERRRSRQTTLKRQSLLCTYPAQHKLESMNKMVAILQNRDCTCASSVVEVLQLFGLHSIGFVGAIFPNKVPTPVVFPPGGGDHVGSHDIADSWIDSARGDGWHSCRLCLLMIVCLGTGSVVIVIAHICMQQRR